MIEYLYKEEQGYVSLSFEGFLGIFIMHVKLKNWNISEYKRYKIIWKGILSELKNRGLEQVFSLVNEEDKKAQRFNEFFGFTHTSFQMDSVDGRKLLLMRLKI